jgi:hypothetical protein
VANGDFADAIVEAFSAFEIALFTLVSGHLDKHCTSKALRESLERRLNVFIMMGEILPEICQQFEIKVSTTALPKRCTDSANAAISSSTAVALSR